MAGIGDGEAGVSGGGGAENRGCQNADAGRHILPLEALHTPASQKKASLRSTMEVLYWISFSATVRVHADRLQRWKRCGTLKHLPA